MKHKTAILELVAILIISAICVYIVCNDLTIIEQIPIWLMVSLIQQLIWYYLNKRT